MGLLFTIGVIVLLFSSPEDIEQAVNQYVEEFIGRQGDTAQKILSDAGHELIDRLMSELGSLESEMMTRFCWFIAGVLVYDILRSVVVCWYLKRSINKN